MIPFLNEKKKKKTHFLTFILKNADINVSLAKGLEAFSSLILTSLQAKNAKVQFNSQVVDSLSTEQNFGDHLNVVCSLFKRTL